MVSFPFNYLVILCSAFCRFHMISMTLSLVCILIIYYTYESHYSSAYIYENVVKKDR